MDPRDRARLHRVVQSKGCWVVEVFGGEPPEWSGFAMGQRGEGGAVVLAIYPKEHRSTGFPAASGGLAFDLLLSAAAADGSVPAILGEWHASSDNFKEYKRRRSLGARPEDAALGTFTGRCAAGHGYGRVTSVEERGEVVKVRFEPGGAP